MRIDVTDWDTKNNTDFVHIIDWLSDTFGKGRISDRQMFQIIADTWRIYATSNSIEGLYETTYWLEFDNDSDATSFLLKWS